MVFVRYLTFAPVSWIAPSLKPFILFLSGWFSAPHWVSFPNYLPVYFLNLRNLLETETLLGMLLLRFPSTPAHLKISNCLMTWRLGWQLWNYFSSPELASRQQPVHPTAYMAFIFGSQCFPVFWLLFVPQTRIISESFSSSVEGSFIFDFPVVYANNLSVIFGFSS